MDLSSYITSGLTILINDSFVIDGTTVDCVFNQSSHKFGDKNYGFPTEDTNALTFTTSDFPTIKQYKGLKLTHGGQEFRILDIQYGVYVTTLLIVDAKKL